MAVPRLSQVRLESFKSFRDQRLPVDPVTLLTGRNSTGKSNALDALDVLARLAAGESLADSLDGRRREGGPVRGGSIGLPPHGRGEFSLGCVVESGPERYIFSVTVQVTPELRVVDESLEGPAPAVESGIVETRTLYKTHRPAKNDTALRAEIHNGLRGTNPTQEFRDSRLVLSQVAARLTGSDRAHHAVARGVNAVTTALRGVFHLDPVPHLMRSYVPERDDELRRTGENLSAVLGSLRRRDASTFERIVRLVQDVTDDHVRDVTVTRSELNDVMIALSEHRGLSSDLPELTPAREMSDGLLRVLAVATALLTSNHGLDLDTVDSPASGAAGVLLVIEELENGLHPSQASRVLDLVRDANRELGTGVLVTTHSPALLDAAEGELNRSVIVCYRDPESGLSRLSRLTDLDGYARAMASGSLGSVVTQGKLTGPTDFTIDLGALDRLLATD